jgi:ABC-2 type transport system permease protein
MTSNSELIKVHEMASFRGFSNLFQKENRAWWRTRRWWINAILWPVILCGLMVNLLFLPRVADLAPELEVAEAGGLIPFLLLMGLRMFFEFGLIAVAIGIVILTQDMIIGEKLDGTAEWLLSKPVSRRAYLLSKLVATLIPMVVLIIAIPSVIAYGLLSLRGGTLYPLMDFLGGVGIFTLHTCFYLTLTMMLGALFDKRGPVLAISLGSIIGGLVLGDMIRPLLFIMPWSMPKLASLAASGQPLLAPLGNIPIIATGVWCLIFLLIALVKLEKSEF